MEIKNWGQTLIGALQGINNEGSAKRVSSFYLLIAILSPLILTYCYGVIYSIHATIPTQVHIILISSIVMIIGLVLLAVTTWLGFATIELITSIVKKFTGDKENSKVTNEDKQ